MAGGERLQVIDLSSFSIDVDTHSVVDESLQDLAEAVYESFTTSGFLYVKNHGIKHDQLTDLLKVTNDFFALPDEIKQKYRRPEDSNGGYVAVEREGLNPKRPADLKEAYNVSHTSLPSMIWPFEEVPDFKRTAEQFYNSCWELSKRLLTLMAVSLKLKDKDFLWKQHVVKDDTIHNTLRILRYPPLLEQEKPNQIRCGEHSDYGSITLLFQDEIGGLEILGKDGQWKPVVPIKDTIVVNVADLMQRWTSDVLVSTKHRVVIPEDETMRRQVRNSVAFFVHPSENSLIECLDGSSKYEPITSGDYIRMRFAETY